MAELKTSVDVQQRGYRARYNRHIHSIGRCLELNCWPRSVVLGKVVMMLLHGFDAAVSGVYFDDLALQFVVVSFGGVGVGVGVLKTSFAALSPLAIDR